MTKKYIPYILFAIGCLSACRADFYEPETPPSQESGLITLTVSDAGYVSVEESGSRSYDNRSETVFEPGDRVGLIITDKAGTLLADNVPYIYDGTKWDFDAENGENKPNKQRVYFDNTMSNYIVYYPYTPTADGTKSVDELLRLDRYHWREDQSSEEAFRMSDLIAWTHQGSPIKDLNAGMKHQRNALSLDFKVRCRLTLKDESGEPITIYYRPKQMIFGEGDSILTSSFEDFTIKLGDDEILGKTYNGQISNGLARIDKEDGAYRYILPDDCPDSFRWHFYYRGKTYAGECEIKTTKGVRYNIDQIIDLGDYWGETVSVGDFYCRRGTTGYVLPYEALEYLPVDTCIGIVYHKGIHKNDGSSTLVGYDDISEYPAEVMNNVDHGYVVSLTETNGIAHSSSDDDNGAHEWSIPLEWMKTNAPDHYWTGYWNSQLITSHPAYKQSTFPAMASCENYGKEDWNKALEAPANTSGWYLPAFEQIDVICRSSELTNIMEERLRIVSALNDIKHYVKPLANHKIEWVTRNYWSSTEVGEYKEDNRLSILLGYKRGVNHQPLLPKNSKAHTRAVLTY